MYKFFVKMVPEDWKNIINTNLLSAFHTTHHIVPKMMERQKGHIINIGSMASFPRTTVKMTAYASAKAGLMAFTRTLAKETGRFNILVNLVSPFFTNTDINKDDPQEAKDAMVAEIPLGRAAEPQDIANLVGWLAFENTFVSGQAISVDGGWS